MVKRKHLHILNVVRSLLFQAKLPKIFWSYAVVHVVHLINRLPSPVLQNKNPFEMLFHEPPTLLNLKVFGSLCFSSTLDNNRTKLDPRANKCVCLGFKSATKCYIFYLKRRELSISRDVVFYEHIFPCFRKSDKSSDSDPTDSYSIDQLTFCMNLLPLKLVPHLQTTHLLHTLLHMSH